MNSEYDNKQEKITIAGIASISICAAAPLMRMLVAGRGLMTWVTMFAFLCLVLSVMKSGYRKFTLLSPQQISIIVISLMMLFSILFLPNEYIDFSLDNIKVQLCTILLFLYVLNNRETKVLLYISTIVSMYFIYCYFFSSEFYLRGIRKYIMIQDSVFLDPNMATASFIIPVTFAVSEILHHKRRLVKALNIVFISLSIYGAFLGASRGATLAIALSVIVYLLLEFKPTGKTLLGIFGGLILFLIILSIVARFIPEELLSRMTLANVQADGGSGRFGLYEDHISRFFNESNVFHMLFGYGRESCKLLLGISSHNIVIDFLWDLGVFGVAILLFINVHLLMYCIKSKSKLAVACLIGIYAWSMTISTGNQLLYYVLLYTTVCIAKSREVFE